MGRIRIHCQSTDRIRIRRKFSGFGSGSYQKSPDPTGSATLVISDPDPTSSNFWWLKYVAKNLLNPHRLLTIFTLRTNKFTGRLLSGSTIHCKNRKGRPLETRLTVSPNWKYFQFKHFKTPNIVEDSRTRFLPNVFLTDFPDPVRCNRAWFRIFLSRICVDILTGNRLPGVRITRKSIRNA